MHLLEQSLYDPNVLEREMHLFVTNWNDHRIRFQKDTILPDGVPEHIHTFSEKYSLEKCGLSISEKQLQQVVEPSGVLRISDEYLENDFKSRWTELVE